MFCADYIAAFVYHAIITIGSVHFFDRFNDKSKNETRKAVTEFATNGLGIRCKRYNSNTEHVRQTSHNEKTTDSVIPFYVGIASGLAASATSASSPCS